MGRERGNAEIKMGRERDNAEIKMGKSKKTDVKDMKTRHGNLGFTMRAPSCYTSICNDHVLDWSSGQDAALSRLNQGFDSPIEYQ